MAVANRLGFKRIAGNIHQLVALRLLLPQLLRKSLTLPAWLHPFSCPINWISASITTFLVSMTHPYVVRPGVVNSLLYKVSEQMVGERE